MWPSLPQPTLLANFSTDLYPLPTISLLHKRWIKPPKKGPKIHWEILKRKENKMRGLSEEHPFFLSSFLRASSCFYRIPFWVIFFPSMPLLAHILLGIGEFRTFRISHGVVYIHQDRGKLPSVLVRLIIIYNYLCSSLPFNHDFLSLHPPYLRPLHPRSHKAIYRWILFIFTESKFILTQKNSEKLLLHRLVGPSLCMIFFTQNYYFHITYALYSG